MKNNDFLNDTVCGVSLKDYAEITYYRAEGINTDDLFLKLGINRKIWAEIDYEWRKRMEKDESFVLITRYSQYYNNTDKKKNR